MPVHKVMTTVNGKPTQGYKWGNSGKIYTGRGAAQKAAQQGQAIHASGYKSSGIANGK